ncbi:pre-mRNA-splicing regulator WTAP [Exaiptasia diaphana]|uniref:Pre-mRNA-splicing regulator WTAP n=1 Tax=Exaiptasia diaphana TaxID=2652724 RepID=A0A913XYA7_EXADI|nr:pre-mRNA-splicing regulator WTAP [Exaiptasia diaphana]KXJ23764.1 Pre-mRNA-splicing regulator WTAP [Exaiptasia diaphana]
MAEKETAPKTSSSEVDKDEPAPKRIRLGSTELKETSEFYTKWKEQDDYIDYLESKMNGGDPTSNSELAGLRESEEKLKQQQQESTRRENVLVMRLATKEHEVQDLLTQIHDMKQAQNPSAIQMRSTLLDPAVNLLFQRMKTELDESKEKLEQAQGDLGAWKFTADSVTGKKLMAKCRMLIQENQELGRQLSQGRVAQLEAELALQKKYSDELKSSQDELNGFVIQLDEEVEGMQSTIMTLQQQLKTIKHQLSEQTTLTQDIRTKCSHLEKELEVAKQQYAETMATKEQVENKDLGGHRDSHQSADDMCQSPTPNERTSPSTIISTTTNNVPSSFSINNILSLDPKPDNAHTVGTLVSNIENGQEGGVPREANPSPEPLEPSDTQTLVTKGLVDGIGTEVSVINVGAVN